MRQRKERNRTYQSKRKAKNSSSQQVEKKSQKMKSGLAKPGKKSVLGRGSTTKHRSGVVVSEVKLDTGEVDMNSARSNPNKDNRQNAPICSGSENDPSSADEGHHPKRRGVVKHKRGTTEGVIPRGKPQKKTRGRVKIKMEFIKNKARRYTTFSKRKIGLMKKAYELAMLTGTQVLLLVVSETGHVYTNTTRKLQPMITGEEGKALMQTCFNSPDPPADYDPSTDARISNKGFEEADMTFLVPGSESLEFTEDARLRGATSSSSAQSTVPTATSATLQMSSGLSFPNYLPTVPSYGNFTDQFPLTMMPAGTPYPPGTPTISLRQLQQHTLAPQRQHGQALASSAPMPHGPTGHMVYNNPHAVLYSTHNRQQKYVYPQGPSAIQSYTQTQ